MSSNEHVDTLIDVESQALLSAIGNHEAKSLLAAVINSQPNSGFSARQLTREMVSRQGDNPAWAINSGTINDYCAETLLPIGAVARQDEAYGSRLRRVYSASEFGMERGLPFVGAILEWSLAYPGHSVQKLLGITAVTGEAVRSPVMSFLIMQELVTNPCDAEISIASIGRSLGRGINDTRIVEGHLQRLESEKLVELRTVVQDYNPVFKINRFTAEDTTLTNGISIAIRDIWLDSPKDEMILSEVVDAVSAKYPDLAPDSVRSVMSYVVAKQRLPFLEVTDRNGTPIDQTAVELTKDGKRLLGAFVEVIEASQDVGQDKYKKSALKIISDKNSFRLLMDKAKKSSNAATTALNRNVVMDEIKASGQVTVTQLREALAGKGTKVSAASVRVFLSAMTEANLLQAESTPLAKDLKRKAVHYRLVE